MSNTKNLTISLTKEEHADLEILVNYFQKRSISNVSKSDVIKFMISQMKLAVEQDKVSEMREILEEGGDQ